MVSEATPQHPLANLPPTIAALSASSETSSTDASAGRRIVLCLDGTGDQFDCDNSNIVKIYASLRKETPHQLTYYQAGIGTAVSPIFGRIQHQVQETLDQAVGLSLGQHVRDAYQYLMQNYQDGDKICIFGFSRGAYTARALAGMLYKVGLLTAHNQAQLSYAYKWYKDDSELGWSMCHEFKKTFSMVVHVYFMGCYDTVSSVGIIPRKLPFSKGNRRAVQYFRHALSLDDRRVKFLPSQWARVDGARNNGQTYTDLDGTSKSNDALIYAARKTIGRVTKRPNTADVIQTLFDPAVQFFVGESSPIGAVLQTPVAIVSALKQCIDMLLWVSLAVLQSVTLWAAICARHTENFLWIGNYDSQEQKRFEERFEEKEREREEEEREREDDGSPVPDTDALSVYFSGSHSDVGGGSVPNVEPRMQSRIALRWMIRQAFECDTGILFRTDVLAEHGMDVDSLFPTLKRRVPMMQPDFAQVKENKSAPSDKSTFKAIPKRIDCTLDHRTDPRLTSASSTKMPLTVENVQTQDAIFDDHHADNKLFVDLVSEPNSSPQTQRSHLTSHSSHSTALSSLFHDGDQATQKQAAMPVPTPSLNASPSLSVEDIEDHLDAAMPIEDMLVENKAWWILEAFPFLFRTKMPVTDALRKVRCPHLGRYRTVSDKEPLMHYTTVLRLMRAQSDYQVQNATRKHVHWKIVA